MLDKEGAEEKELLGEVMPFELNPVVAEAQELLYIYGYNTGKVDGRLGLRTRNAIEKFQRDNGIEPSRFIDNATWEKLIIFRDSHLIVEQQLNTLLIQSILKEAGLDPGVIDGKMGNKTKAAVKKFQKAHGLKPDGKIGYQTLSKMSAYLPAQ